MTNQITVKDIKYCLGDSIVKISGNENITINGYSLLSNPQSKTVFFIRDMKKSYDFGSIEDAIIIIPAKNSDEIQSQLISLNCCVLIVDDPRLNFLRILNSFFVKKLIPNIHPTAIIANNIDIPDNCYIGPYVAISEDCTIGNNTIIHSHAKLYSQTHLGKNTIVHSGVVIGADGLGFQKNEAGIYEKFPQLGGVIISDDVEIGANSCIDCGALGNTIIHSGVKIDNHVHIAHNVEIGKDTMITAKSMVAGGTKVGKNCWLAPSCSLMNGLTIGDNVFVGMGAIVTKNVSNNLTVIGNPAQPISQYKKERKALLKTIKGSQ